MVRRAVDPAAEDAFAQSVKGVIPGVHHVQQARIDVALRDRGIRADGLQRGVENEQRDEPVAQFAPFASLVAVAGDRVVVARDDDDAPLVEPRTV